MINPDRPAASNEIEITPKMVEAGVLVAREHCLGAPLADLVTQVYLAMSLEQGQLGLRPAPQDPLSSP